MTPRARMRSRGFVFVAAVLLVALVGAAMAAITAVVAADARRTQSLAINAQLEFMLLAAASDAPARLATQPPAEGQSWTLDLPDSLTSPSASLKITVRSLQPNTSATLQIQATLDTHHAEQSVTFQTHDNTWKLTAAELEE